MKLTKETKNGLAGLSMALGMVIVVVIVCLFVPDNSSRSEEAMTGRYIQNNHTQPAWEKLKIGMTNAEVKTVWGNYAYRSFKHNQEGTQEKWYYNFHLGSALILTFENGILIQWEG